PVIGTCDRLTPASERLLGATDEPRPENLRVCGHCRRLIRARARIAVKATGFAECTGCRLSSFRFTMILEGAMAESELWAKYHAAFEALADEEDAIVG